MPSSAGFVLCEICHSARKILKDEFFGGESFVKRYPVTPMARYVFITGGVVSSLGKGIAAAALGALLQARGYRVRLRKLDPYLNVIRAP